MKAKWILVLSVLMILASQTQALAAEGFYMTGYNLVELMRVDDKFDIGSATTGEDGYNAGKYCGYILGVFDAAMSSARDVPYNAKVGQIVAVVSKYLKNHPEKWNEPAVHLVIKALQEAFPLKGGK